MKRNRKKIASLACFIGSLDSHRTVEKVDKTGEAMGLVRNVLLSAGYVETKAKQGGTMKKVYCTKTVHQMIVECKCIVGNGVHCWLCSQRR